MTFPEFLGSNASLTLLGTPDDDIQTGTLRIEECRQEVKHERRSDNQMGAPNKGQTFKRLSINLTEEIDMAVVSLRSKKEYVRCSYVECIRILIAEGAKAMAARYQNSDEKT